MVNIDSQLRNAIGTPIFFEGHVGYFPRIWPIAILATVCGCYFDTVMDQYQINLFGQFRNENYSAHV